MTHDSPRFDMFENRVGQTLHFMAEPENLPVKLAEAKRLSHGQREGGSFSLIMETDAVIEQGTYRLIGEDGLDIAVFIVPIGPFGDGNGYETVFN